MAKDITAPQSTNVSVESLLDQYAGAGSSAAAEHNTIPMVYVLQTNSPQVNKRGDAYVDGAEAGDLWVKNGVTPVRKGEEGFTFIPCMFQWSFVEWRPNREGFVASHPRRPVEATQQQLDPNDERMSWVMPNGNIVVDTCYVFGLVDETTTYVIPLSSSNYRVARDWNTDVRNRKHNGNPLPVFATRYQVKTTFRSNAKGEWFTLAFQFIEGMPSVDKMQTGLEFFKAVNAGVKAPVASETPF